MHGLYGNALKVAKCFCFSIISVLMVWLLSNGANSVCIGKLKKHSTLNRHILYHRT